MKETGETGNTYYLTEGLTGYSAHAMLPLGSYVFGGGNSNIQNLQNETFTVTEEDDVVSVNTQLYRVSGYCKLNGVNVSDDARITFFDKNRLRLPQQMMWRMVNILCMYRRESIR